MRFSLAVLVALLWLTTAAGQEASLPLESWWDALAGQDGPASFQALWHFVEKPKETVAFFDSRLKPAVAPDRRDDRHGRD